MSIAQVQGYDKGDWIVHLHHGIGQITGTRISDISGEETTYCEVQTSDSTVWIPIDQMTEDVLRPLCSPEEIEDVIDVLSQPPKKMPANFNKRKHRINRVRRSNSPVDIARLVRDLRARRRSRGNLSNTESRALRSLSKRLVNEWSASREMTPEAVQQQIEKLLRKRPNISQRQADNSAVVM